MKKLAWLILSLLLLSLACRALVLEAVRADHGSVSVKATQIDPIPTSTATLITTSTPGPTPKPITCTDDDCLEACLKRIEKTVSHVEYEPLTGAYAENEIDLNLVYYEVKDGQLGKPQFLYVPEAFKPFQQDTNSQQTIWRYASSLLPPDQLKWISGFEIFKSSNYSGRVSPGGSYQDDRTHWTLGIELEYAQDPVDVTYTLVHEYGHMLSLNTDQIPESDFYYSWLQDPTHCKQLATPYGCSKSDSYMNQFYQYFWTDLLEEWEKTVDGPGMDTPKEADALVQKFYDKHSKRFVDDYAATNIDEDFAETFMYFVLLPKPEEGGSINQKIRFFYKFPELVALRQQMIQNICSYTE
jgi:hypothetical protein